MRQQVNTMETSVERSSQEWKTIPIGDEWSSKFRNFGSHAFRLENLQAYAEPNESSPFNQYLRGVAPPPDWTQEWCDMVAKHINAGRAMRRVHVVDLPLSDYMKFEIAHCYIYTGASGEEIRLIDRASLAPELASLCHEDFWLFDKTTVMVNDYDTSNQLYQARINHNPGIVARYVSIEEQLWSHAVPFLDFYKEVTGENLQLIACGSRERWS